jgi:hypothetical protein
MTAAPATLKKTCGSCTFCCKLFEIAAFEKPVGTWCQHCKIGSGCGIYESRPQECRDFACQWLRFEDMPDNLRPDRTKVILCIEPPGERLVARCDTATPMAWRQEPMYGFLKRYAQGGWRMQMCVYAVAGERIWLIAPNEDVDVSHLPRGVPLAITQGADGKVQVAVAPPSAQSPAAGSPAVG